MVYKAQILLRKWLGAWAAEENAEDESHAGGSSDRGPGEQENIPLRGTEGRANTEFAGSLLDRVGHYALDSDGRQAKCNEGENTAE
jgi:hypothetical protein